jgi:hypothetical protein
MDSYFHQSHGAQFSCSHSVALTSQLVLVFRVFGFTVLLNILSNEIKSKYFCMKTRGYQPLLLFLPMSAVITKGSFNKRVFIFGTFGKKA